MLRNKRLFKKKNTLCDFYMIVYFPCCFVSRIETSIYETRLFVCFVYTYEIHWIRMFQIIFLIFWKAFDEEGCMGFVPLCLDVMQKFLNIEWLIHYKLN